MYKATVEAISGLKVRAGGKWLTCIGNRAVKVGDRIWTDGRCAYGHDRETQAPIIAANPVKENLTIPISFSSRRDFSPLRNVMLLNIPPAIKTLPQFLTMNGSKAGHSPKWIDDGNRYFYVASNIDADGNSHTISKCLVEYQSQLVIRKNGTIISTFDIAPLRQSVANAANSALDEEISNPIYARDNSGSARLIVARRSNAPFEDSLTYRENYYYEIAPRLARGSTVVMEWAEAIKYQPLYTFHVDTSKKIPSGDEVISGFIEDENNWWVLVNIRERASARGQKVIELSDPISARFLLWIRSYWITPMSIEAESIESRTYLISNSGVRLVFRSARVYSHVGIDYETLECAVVRELAQLPPVNEGGYTLRDDRYRNTSGYVGQIFFMHDGFYLKVEQIIQSSSGEITTGFPLCMVATIYSPQNSPILTETFMIGATVTACKLNISTFLIGVCNNTSSDSNVFVGSGLYLCRDGKLTKISSGTLYNQCLRPMKRYKNWWERVQILE